VGSNISLLFRTLLSFQTADQVLPQQHNAPTPLCQLRFRTGLHCSELRQPIRPAQQSCVDDSGAPGFGHSGGAGSTVSREHGCRGPQVHGHGDRRPRHGLYDTDLLWRGLQSKPFHRVIWIRSGLLSSQHVSFSFGYPSFAILSSRQDTSARWLRSD
jgi:hypothetical protein